MDFSHRHNRGTECFIGSIARRRVLTIVIVFLLSFGGSWGLSLYYGIPVPYHLDEFSFLLSADTFAHGRITNPPHPLWQHFEAFYELMQPTYMSKYPPAQGAFLAFGKVLFGHPIWGVWISDGLMSAAICWMLYAWVRAPWALIGGLIAVVQFGVFTYWSQSYWGGAVAAMAGALVFGAIPRILKHQRMRDVLWLGLGLALLLNTRPMEGVILEIPLGIMVLPWQVHWKEMIISKFVKKVIIPFCICLVLIAGFMGYYNKQITGDPFLLPAQLYLNTYSIVPLFIWQPVKPAIQYRHREMGQYINTRENGIFLEKRTWKGLYQLTLQNYTWFFFFGSIFAGLALGAFAVIQLSWKRTFIFILTAIVLLLYFLTVFCFNLCHYYASFTCLLILWVVTGLRVLSMTTLRKTRLGLAAIVFLILCQSFMNGSKPDFLNPPLYARAVSSNGIGLPNQFTRQQLVDILMKRGEKYVVIVQYPIKFNTFDWVFNDADIDHSPIVWARNMNDEENKKLLAYFKDRHVIVVQIGDPS